MRRRLSLVFLVLGGGLMILGGLGDALMRTPPDAWERVLGAPMTSLPPGTTRLLLTLLHALGGALIASGIAVLALVHGPLRRGATRTLT